VQKRDGGFSVVLNGTGTAAAAEGTIEGVASPLVQALKAQQLGEDLVVWVTLSEVARSDAVEVRTRQATDAIRGLHTFRLDFVPSDGGAEAVHRANAALARIDASDVSGCSLIYDTAMREQLGIAELARALSANGSFTDPYLRAAMKRLGRLSNDGVITLTDGSRFQASAPIELMAAVSQSAEAVGYLALLRSFVAELEPPEGRRQTLRGLISPELPVARFDAIATDAEAQESSCRAGARGRSGESWEFQPGFV
jgi:hypothetical protein